MKEIKNDIRKKYKYKDYVVYIKDVKDIEEIIESNIEDYIKTYKEDYED